MSENSESKANGKILFGADYLNIMYNMEMPAAGEKRSAKAPIIDAIIKLFLLQWGFSVKEIDDANALFWEKAEKRLLDPEINTVLERVFSFVKNDREAQERLMIEIAAVGLLDGNVTEDERFFANYFKEKFDLKPSEFNALVNKGQDWHIALEYLGAQYEEFYKKQRGL